ncbi:hypothetical protein HYH03_010851 [Edaphochlamys debaryana]|uniref:Uncharacterized protein n=1 Tax=Edaphochlamys debaryana TaxID=47281 RepID=A0A836BX11_9CHLO|nr:hypothetical protein HYH03_010851 [Edaphochlamys debaryana]|eukprot:KAG2490689.1 hypothetical protein HYH03_010851 [Edaphochlamys debaryana]
MAALEPYAAGALAYQRSQLAGVAELVHPTAPFTAMFITEDHVDKQHVNTGDLGLTVMAWSIQDGKVGPGQRTKERVAEPDSVHPGWLTVVIRARDG